MLKAILGSALGGVVAGAVALVASAQGRAPAAPSLTPFQPAHYAAGDSRSVTPAAVNTSSFVQCEPHQEAVLQRSIVGDRDVAQVVCVTHLAPAGYAAVGGYAAPVVYQDPRFAYAQPDIVQRPIVERDIVRPRAQRVVYRETAPKRSWRKSALIIGGSAGTGAGVGAIAGGKKGALIGAAIGGGAASIYEAIKR